jgi:Family of unknown function (DUF5360)
MNPPLSPRLKLLMVLTDFGFIAYWVVTFLHLLPDAWLYQDYTNPLLVSWNVSFMPIDLLISASGLTALGLARRHDARSRPLAIISLTLTSASGLMAIAFWALRGDFEVAWWLPNLFLLTYPAFFVPGLLRQPPQPSRSSTSDLGTGATAPTW